MSLVCPCSRRVYEAWCDAEVKQDLEILEVGYRVLSLGVDVMVNESGLAGWCTSAKAVQQDTDLSCG